MTIQRTETTGGNVWNPSRRLLTSRIYGQRTATKQRKRKWCEKTTPVAEPIRTVASPKGTNQWLIVTEQTRPSEALMVNKHRNSFTMDVSYSFLHLRELSLFQHRQWWKIHGLFQQRARVSPILEWCQQRYSIVQHLINALRLYIICFHSNTANVEIV